MHIGVWKEHADGERRVALTPDTAVKLVDKGHRVVVESGAGLDAGIEDDAFRSAGVDIGAPDAVRECEVSLAVRGAGTWEGEGSSPTDTLRSGALALAMFDPLWLPKNAQALAATGADVMSLELVPRITRAQSMDVLSSMATVAGYEAALLAASKLPRMFPLMMTAAGTLAAARVFVLGAGVAGLQAIATARRLGAIVEGYDVRPAAAEQIRSLGAKAVELDLDTADSEDAGGYAREQSEDANARQQRLLTPYIAESDVIITTAAIPGRPSPELITAPMVEAMTSGSIIIDLAAERGGNCAVTVADAEVVHAGVTVLGPTDLASRSPRHASQMLGNNLVTLLDHLSDDDGQLVVDHEDEITGAMLVATGGEVVHERVLDALGSSAPTPTPDAPTEA